MKGALIHADLYVLIPKKLREHIWGIEIIKRRSEEAAAHASPLELGENLHQRLQAALRHKCNANIKAVTFGKLTLDNRQEVRARALVIGNQPWTIPLRNLL